MKMKGIGIMNEKLYAEKSFHALGTLNDIKLFGCGDKRILDLALRRVLEIEQRMSAYMEDSDVSRINRNAGTDLVEIHPETAALIKKSITFSILSDGAFDITVRPLVELWGSEKKETKSRPRANRTYQKSCGLQKNPAGRKERKSRIEGKRAGDRSRRNRKRICCGGSETGTRRERRRKCVDQSRRQHHRSRRTA